VTRANRLSLDYKIEVLRQGALANRLDVMKYMATLVATFGYVGYVPFAPGTAGSLGALALYFFARNFYGGEIELPLLVVVTVLGIWAASVTERSLQKKDPGLVVIDEVAGMLLTLLWVEASIAVAFIGFLAFRFFDIVKPFPARYCERFRGGWGIMLDDLVAGVYAALTVRAILWVQTSF